MKRTALFIAALLVLAPATLAAATTFRGTLVAGQLCGWLNGKTAAPLDFRMGIQTEAVLRELRATQPPFECALGHSPYLDSFFTETAVSVRSPGGRGVGLRVAPLGEPAIVGFWTF